MNDVPEEKEDSFRQQGARELLEGKEPLEGQGMLEGTSADPGLSRREFLKLAGVAGAAVAVGGGLGGLLAACGDGETTTTTATAASTTEAASTTVSSEATATTATASTTTVPPMTEPPAGSDALTVGVTEGPYYIAGTAQLPGGDLNYAGLPGDPVKISGYVYGGVGTSKPLSGAKVDLWHCDSDGSYHPNTNGDASQFQASELALRGYVLTDADGYYEFTSIYPGIYPGRCRHIHVRTSADDYGAVVSQLIVPALEGDSFTPEDDQIAGALPPVNDLVFTTVGGVREASFDFHLGGD